MTTINGPVIAAVASGGVLACVAQPQRSGRLLNRSLTASLMFARGRLSQKALMCCFCCSSGHPRKFFRVNTESFMPVI